MGTAPRNHAFKLRVRVVELRLGAGFIAHQAARFGDQQAARRDVPFPGCAQGQHCVKLAFGDERQAIRERGPGTFF